MASSSTVLSGSASPASVLPEGEGDAADGEGDAGAAGGDDGERDAFASASPERGAARAARPGRASTSRDDVFSPGRRESGKRGDVARPPSFRGPRGSISRDRRSRGEAIAA